MNDTSLDGWRKDIDELDMEFLHILAKRMQIVEKIGAYKKEHGLPVHDQHRHATLLAARIVQGRMVGLAAKFVEDLWAVIHNHAVEIEEKEAP